MRAGLRNKRNPISFPVTTYLLPCYYVSPSLLLRNLSPLFPKYYSMHILLNCCMNTASYAPEGIIWLMSHSSCVVCVRYTDSWDRVVINGRIELHRENFIGLSAFRNTFCTFVPDSTKSRYDEQNIDNKEYATDNTSFIFMCRTGHDGRLHKAG